MRYLIWHEQDTLLVIEPRQWSTSCSTNFPFRSFLFRSSCPPRFSMSTLGNVWFPHMLCTTYGELRAYLVDTGQDSTQPKPGWECSLLEAGSLPHTVALKCITTPHTHTCNCKSLWIILPCHGTSSTMVFRFSLEEREKMDICLLSFLFISPFPLSFV